MTLPTPRPTHRALVVAGWLAVVAFAVLAGRFWHPYYGFTKFVQLDEYDARNGIHEVRENPIYVYAGENGYDGAAYAQIAYHPLLDSPELEHALGNVPYRARRILGSALAWVFAGGNPVQVANVYAGLNLAVWLALAGLLWRVLPVTDARSWLAWVGVMFSAGALHAVRLALTDLLAATLVVAGIWLGERGRTGGAIGAIAVGGLARETALANIVALWRGPWRSARSWGANLVFGALAALPLVLWVGYVRWKAGPAPQGFGNFTWPIVGWIEKWGEVFADYGRHPEFRWLTTTTLLAVVALTIQAIYLLRVRRMASPWWLAGMSGVAMMALLGTSVWEGHPGAATRVLLPMGAVFAVFAVRERAGVAWILGGSLTIFSGVLALWSVPADPAELGAGRAGGGYVAKIDSGWYGVERSKGAAWAWTAERGTLRIVAAKPFTSATQVRVKLRAIQPREVKITVAGRPVWEGNVTDRAQWVSFTPAAETKTLVLELASATAAVRENDHPDARALGFAVYGITLE